MKNLIRKIWHDIFYVVSYPWGEKFALTCKSVTESIDLRTKPQSKMTRIRILLHLSLCQACNNYFKASRALHKIIVMALKDPNQNLDLEKLNKELLEKYSRDSAAKK